MTKYIRQFHRELLTRLEQNLNFMQVVLGPRQVGKTTAVLDICKNWKEGRTVYASADLPVSPGRAWLREQWQAARAFGPNGLLVLDEIHKVEGWSSEVKVLFDEERVRENRLRVVLLGSASWTIQRGLGDSLAGRFEVIKAPHWSFREMSQLFGWDFETYLRFGGYPSPVTLLPDIHRWQDFMRDSIIEPMLSKDLMALREVSKSALFRQTFELMLRYPAQEISLQKLLGQLSDSGNSTTIRGYLELLEAGFILKCLSKFSTRPITTKASSPKLIQMCPALFSAFNDPERIKADLEWRGRVFEAEIGSFLVQNFRDVTYWRDGNDEVDFVVNTGERLFAIEVMSGRSRRSRGLETFLRSFQDAAPVILNWESGLALLQSDKPLEFLKSLAA